MIVPSVELPPVTPPTLQFTVDAKLPVPLTLAEHCEVLPVRTVVGAQVAVTPVMVGVGVDVDPESDLPLPHPVSSARVMNPDKPRKRGARQPRFCGMG